MEVATDTTYILSSLKLSDERVANQLHELFTNLQDCVCITGADWNIFTLNTHDFPTLLQVGTAVKFLQNPKVNQSPLATRKAFLKKKGE